jgi:hypothetical protein
MTHRIAQFLAGLKPDNVVAWWKAISIGLTGIFGILGLLTNFRDEHTKKVTKWGYISLYGIVISSVFGVLAQLKESSDDSAQALAIAKNSELTLNEIKRGLYLLEDPHVGITFDVPCSESRFKSFCKDILRRDTYVPLDENKWVDWPGEPKLTLDVGFFLNRNDAEAESKSYFGILGKGNLEWIVEGSEAKGADTLYAEHAIDDRVLVEVETAHPSIIHNDRNLTSLLDFPGKTVVIAGVTDELYGLLLTGFTVQSKNGENIHFVDPPQDELKQVLSDAETFYFYTFPVTATR